MSTQLASWVACFKGLEKFLPQNLRSTGWQEIVLNPCKQKCYEKRIISDCRYSDYWLVIRCFLLQRYWIDPRLIGTGYHCLISWCNTKSLKS
jgi:hypothetical protein